MLEEHDVLPSREAATHAGAIVGIHIRVSPPGGSDEMQAMPRFPHLTVWADTFRRKRGCPIYDLA